MKQLPPGASLLHRIAYRVRWGLLAAGLLSFGAGFWLIFWPADWGGPLGAADAHAATGAFFGCFFLAQFLFLAPRRNWRVRLAEHGRPMWLSRIGAGMAMGTVFLALVLTALELPPPTIWDHVEIPDDNPWVLVFSLFGTSWLLWAGIFALVIHKGDHFQKLTRMLQWIIAGTVLEGFIATGVYAWNPHNEDCFCARGSYFGLVFGGTVAVWAFGPGVFLLFASRRYLLLRSAGRYCPNCEYDLTGTRKAGRTECPECGQAIPARAADASQARQ